MGITIVDLKTGAKKKKIAPAASESQVDRHSDFGKSLRRTIRRQVE